MIRHLCRTHICHAWFHIKKRSADRHMGRFLSHVSLMYLRSLGSIFRRVRKWRTEYSGSKKDFHALSPQRRRFSQGNSDQPTHVF